MKAPIKWLKDYVDIDVDAKTLAEKLLKAGFEVEEITNVANEIKNVVVGKIVKTEKHKNADKLTVCQVQIDEKGKTIQIVTAATNVKQGDLIPVALDGAILASGKQITAGELRGEKSFGMFCGGSELNVTDADCEGASGDGVLILNSVTGAKLGQNVLEALDLDCDVLNIDITANRPDCQCVFGIAREVAAVLGKKIKTPNLEFKQSSAKVTDFVKVSVLDKDLCPRYIARAIDNVKIEMSPKFIRSRLRWAGLRPINNIVDITNFILLELGQPMHAFDLANLEGNEIVVRRAKKDEKITTLDEKQCSLNSGNLVICDAKKPVGLAGIMGGLNSEIKNSTKQVVFECAKFARQAIRKTSKELGVKSDSSSMFERGISTYTTEFAIKRALNLVSMMNAGQIASGEIDINAEKREKKVVQVLTTKIDDVLGIKVEPKRMVDILNSLNFVATLKDGMLTCEVPPYREDVDRYPDIAEEIIRLVSYENFEGTMLKNCVVTNGKFSDKQKSVIDLENVLVASGYSEITTYSFIGEKQYNWLCLNENNPLRKSVRLLNPLGEDIALMRTTLVGSMLAVLASNANKKNAEAKMFEIAKSYIAKSLPLTELGDEVETLSLGAYGDKEDFFTLKGAVENVLAKFGLSYQLRRANVEWLHPGRAAEVIVDGDSVGCFGEVHPDVQENFEMPKKAYVGELNVDKLIAKRNANFKYKDVPKFQNTYRDVAVVVSETISCEDIILLIKKNATEICESVELFDVYKGNQIENGKVSMAFKINFRASDRTLKDAEIDPIMQNIFVLLEKELKAELRK